MLVKTRTQLLFQLCMFVGKCIGLEGSCSSSMFHLSAQGSRLHGYVIKEHQVQTRAECTYLCFQSGCKSFNFESGGKISGERPRKCQISNATKSSYPKQLIVEEIFEYWEAANTVHSANTSETSVLTPRVEQVDATSCAQLYKSGVRDNAQYSIDPGNSKMPFNVSCDMTDGGGWTVIQKRFDGSLNFTRNWIDYKKGFGTFDGEFWIGLNKIRRLTSIQSSTLKIVLESFDGEYRHASYSPFKVGDEVNSFILTAKNYIGNAGDSLRLHDGMKFSTQDNDNDSSNWQNCAKAFKGGWWFHNCHSSNLNGFYHHGQYLPKDGDRDGVVWETWKGLQESLKATTMKVRPSNF